MKIASGVFFSNAAIGWTHFFTKLIIPIEFLDQRSHLRVLSDNRFKAQLKVVDGFSEGLVDAKGEVKASLRRTAFFFRLF